MDDARLERLLRKPAPDVPHPHRPGALSPRVGGMLRTRPAPTRPPLPRPPAPPPVVYRLEVVQSAPPYPLGFGPRLCASCLRPWQSTRLADLQRPSCPWCGA